MEKSKASGVESRTTLTQKSQQVFNKNMKVVQTNQHNDAGTAIQTSLDDRLAGEILGQTWNRNSYANGQEEKSDRKRITGTETLELHGDDLRKSDECLIGEVATKNEEKGKQTIDVKDLVEQKK